MASPNIFIKNNTLCFKAALQQSLDFSFLVLYILADQISFLEIQRLQLAGSSNTVFAVILLHIKVFFGGKTKRPCFDLFMHWLIKQIPNTYRNHFSRSYENRSIWEFVTRDTRKCLLSVLTAVRNKRVNFRGNI